MHVLVGMHAVLVCSSVCVWCVMCVVYILYPPASGAGVGISVWICVFGAVQVIISLLKNFNSLRGISLLAAIMSMGYSTIAFALTLKNGK
jgi:hypothetical protein